MGNGPILKSYYNILSKMASLQQKIWDIQRRKYGSYTGRKSRQCKLPEIVQVDVRFNRKRPKSSLQICSTKLKESIV